MRDVLAEPQLGFRTSGLRGWPFVPALDLLARCGAGELELCLEHPATPPDAWRRGQHQRVLALLAERDLRMRCVSYHGKQDDPGIKPRRSRFLLQLTQKLGAQVALVAPPLAAKGWSFLSFAAFCDRLCGPAEDAGIALAVEPEPGTIVPDAKTMERLLDAVGSSALAVGLHLGHAFQSEGSVVESLERLGPRIVHTHWDDMPDGGHTNPPPSEGPTGLVAAARWLLARGYAGPWIVDLVPLGADPEPNVRASIEGLQRVLREARVPPSPTP